MNFEQLEKKVQVYNELPDQEKLGENYKKIKASVNSYRKKLITLETSLDDYPTNVTKSYTDKEFLETVTKLEKLKVALDNESGLEKSVALYQELSQLTLNCKSYLENKTMNIKYLDQQDQDDLDISDEDKESSDDEPKPAKKHTKKSKRVSKAKN